MDKIRAGDKFFTEVLMFEPSSEPSFRPYFCILCPAVFFGWEERLESNEGPGVEFGSASIADWRRRLYWL